MHLKPSSKEAAVNANPRQVGKDISGVPSGDKREHSRKPDEQYDLIESCSKGPYLELFARGTRPGWTYWGNQANKDYKPTWDTYAHNSAAGRVAAE
jgi:N6-adenosine-specific RNA methylase IME4